MVIRYASLSDAADLLPLMAELGYPWLLEDLVVKVTRFLSNPGYGVAVCQMNGKICGWIAWSKSELFVLNKTRFHIEGLIVDSKHRGKNIGKKLMGFVEEIAKSHSPAIIDLTSGLRRAQDGSLHFYNQLGYKNEGPMAKLYLRKEL